MRLDDCKIMDAYVITALRTYPSFQLSISTYKDICTFTAHVQADQNALSKAQMLLCNIINKLKSFIDA